VKAPPAFQFYPNDFVSGTRKMTTTEVGAYMLLLCAQWDDGFVPADDPVALAQTMRCTRTAGAKVWARIREKFIRDDAGRWRNARLEQVRAEQEAFRLRQAQNGARGGRPSKPNSNPNETQTEPKPIPKPNPDESSPISDLQVRTPLPPKGGSRRRQRYPLPDPWRQQERMEEMRRLMAEGLSYADAQRSAFRY